MFAQRGFLKNYTFETATSIIDTFRQDRSQRKMKLTGVYLIKATKEFYFLVFIHSKKKVCVGGNV